MRGALLRNPKPTWDGIYPHPSQHPPTTKRGMEAAPGLEPGMTDLQSVALATWPCRLGSRLVLQPWELRPGALRIRGMRRIAGWRPWSSGEAKRSTSSLVEALKSQGGTRPPAPESPRGRVLTARARTPMGPGVDPAPHGPYDLPGEPAWGHGEIGRRSGLKSRRPQGHPGSIPGVPTSCTRV